MTAKTKFVLSKIRRTCDVCGKSTVHVLYPQYIGGLDDVRSALNANAENLRKLGWWIGPNDFDACPECYKMAKEIAAAKKNEGVV